MREVPVDAGTTTIVELAIAVADADGIGAVTLRAVAGRSGRTLAEVRREFGSRDRLVAAMVHRALIRHRGPSGVGGESAGCAVAALTRIAESEWRAYRAHPWLVGVLASTRPPLVPAVLDAAGAAMEVFAEMGLDPDAARNRYLAFSAYIQGMGLLLNAEHHETGRTATGYRAWWTQELGRLDRTGATGDHPWLTGVSDAAPADGFDADSAFRDGLRYVLSGLTGQPQVP